jgi:8-hydroxy-5-deazaflavin:NADPH oxidoreductase
MKFSAKRAIKTKSGGMRIGILGSGLMGGKLGTLFACAGHDVVFSYARDQKKLERLAREAAKNARAGTPADAAQNADALLLAVNWPRLDDVLRHAGDLDGKVIITCSLPMNEENTELVIGRTSSGAEELAKRLPRARIVAAFNTVPSEVLFDVYKARRKATRPSIVYCGDDRRANKLAATLIRDVGFDAVDAGPLAIARYTEPFALLIAQLAYEGKGGPERVPDRAVREIRSIRHPLDERRIHRLRPLQRRQVSALRDDDQARARNAGGNLLRRRRRREFVGISDHDQRRTGDGGERRPRISPGHNRVLLTDERVRSGLFAHQADNPFEIFIAMTIAMYEQRKQKIECLAKTAGLGEFDARLAGRGLLRRFGRGCCVKERELCHSPARLAHDLERDVAAHRQAQERKTRRRRGQDASRNRRDGFVARVIGDRDRPERPEYRDLLAKKPRRAGQPGNENNRQAFG